MAGRALQGAIKQQQEEEEKAAALSPSRAVGLPPPPQRQSSSIDWLCSGRSSFGDHVDESGGGHRDISIKCGESFMRYSVVTGQIPDDLLANLKRDFTPAEVDMIHARVRKTTAPTGVERPGALFVLGPSAVGKSVFSTAQATALFGSDTNAVIIDGAEFREIHSGWSAVAVHGMENGVLHADAWSAFRTVGSEDGKGGISTRLKKRILDDAMRRKQNLIIPDCANHPGMPRHPPPTAARRATHLPRLAQTGARGLPPLPTRCRAASGGAPGSRV